jgi:DNA repair protein RecN (Recombination protein N)
MLKHLSIRDFAIVDQLSLDLESGFTALTGETGAGKSILVDALALALGDRADAETVRAGAERAEIEVEFDLSECPASSAWLAEQALEGDTGTLLLRRLIERGGRTRAFVNGRSTTLAQLRDIGEQLVDIHGQQEHQLLVRPEVQRAVLDAHGSLEDLGAEVAAAYREWQQWRAAREALAREAGERNQERDRLLWQTEELKRLGLRPGEWDEVQQDHSRLAHAAALIEGAEECLQLLSEGDAAAQGVVSAALTRLRGLVGYDGSLSEAIELCASAEAQLQEAAHALRRYRDRVDLDPDRLRSAEQRLEAIHGVARKLRTRPEELPALLERLNARLAELEETGDDAALAAKETAARSRYDRAAEELGAQRRKTAVKLSREVSAAMKDLALGMTKFEVHFALVEQGSAAGNERTEFMIATNAGIEPRPLARVASGGELSRISLAIQVITSKRTAVPTLIFDEVDAGIGGAVAEAVGRKLAALGRNRQVLCVTHLPQVAAQAGHQWSVTKISQRGSTRSEVLALDQRGRVEEIARMLGGAATTARKHAAELLAARE